MIKTLSFHIRGQSPLLMHKIIPEDLEGTSKRKMENREQEVEKHLYRNDDGNLFIPADNMKECLKPISKLYGGIITGTKRRTKNLYNAFCGGLFIRPDEILLKADGKAIREWQINLKAVRIKNSRILRARAEVFPWEASFEVAWILEIFPSDFELILPDMIAEAGMVVGLMDFRPQKGGPFGRFEAIK